MTPELVLTYSSPQLTEVLGYTPDEVVGRDVLEFMTPMSAKRVRQALAGGILAQGWQAQTSEWVAADGAAPAQRRSAARQERSVVGAARKLWPR